MTIKEAMNFDKAFVTARINQCLRICDFQTKQAKPDLKLFRMAFDQGLRWITNYGIDSGLLPHDLSDLEDRFQELHTFVFLANLDQINEQDQQVSEPAPSTQVQLFRVLGKETKFQSLYALNEQALSPASIPEHCFWPLFSIGWRPSLTLTKRLLSNTRSVGGLA